MQKLFAIMGPTASGKTALAIDLARRVDGEIINCDSMQMYADLPRLSAQPTLEEQDGIPHHLFGVLPGGDKCQAARYVELARPIIAEIRARGKQPILCGGTGLYFKALTEGLARIPPIPIILHDMTVAMHKDIGSLALHAKLAQVDPILADKLKPGDTQRLIRGWEVYVATGTPLSTWQRETHDTQNIERDWKMLTLLPPREKLYDKINRRFDVMLKEGVVDEVRTLLAKNVPGDMPVMKAHGVPEIAKYLRGEWSLEDAAARAQQITRNYAKRQFTWFTNQLGDKYPGQVIKVADFGGSEAARHALGALQ